MSIDNLQFLFYALDHAPAHVHIVQFANLVTRDRVRKHQVDGVTVESGIIPADVPALVARSLRAVDPAQRDWLLLAHVRREVYNELMERAESRIVLPPGAVL